MYVYEKIHHVSMSVYCSNHCYCVTMGYTLRLSQLPNVNITYLAEGGVWGMRLLSKFSEELGCQTAELSVPFGI